MSLGTAEDESAASQIHLPAEIDWEMLDKSKFFFLGAALFSAVSATLYPIIVLKTRQQVSPSQIPCFKIAYSIAKHEGPRGFYRGFGTSLTGTIPARALYMGALEITKSNVGNAALRLGVSSNTAATIANATAGLSAAMAAQLVWTPIDVVTQRLMVQGGTTNGVVNTYRYVNGFDAFSKILRKDGVRGLYRGFGISTMTYAPSNAVWWGSYSMANRVIWESVGGYYCKKDDSRAVVRVQGLSAAIASGFSALVTMPLDTIKTRLQVLGAERSGPTVARTVKDLVKEGGLSACYRGLGPRWASMTMSSTTMISTYEFVKRLSAKDQETFG